MRTAAQCLAKAAQMEAFAISCGAATEAHYRSMAASWRQLAKQAAWQDGFPSLPDVERIK